MTECIMELLLPALVIEVSSISFGGRMQNLEKTVNITKYYILYISVMPRRVVQ